MKINKYIIISSLFLWVLMISFTQSSQVKIPYKKIEKSVKRYLKVQDFRLKPVVDLANQLSQSQLLKIHDSTSNYGYIYISRVNSCRMGGCSMAQHDAAIEFEYFDYYFITDTVGNVINVKVYNYQATHGHQIMSKGWLKQFVGFNGNQSLNYGKDIEAISGATISAKSLTEDIEMAQELIKNFVNSDIN
ncbi:MAG: FMN-binding protein [Bacteroidota bacterium]